ELGHPHRGRLRLGFGRLLRRPFDGVICEVAFERARVTYQLVQLVDIDIGVVQHSGVEDLLDAAGRPSGPAAATREANHRHRLASARLSDNWAGGAGCSAPPETHLQPTMATHVRASNCR